MTEDTTNTGPDAGPDAPVGAPGAAGWQWDRQKTMISVIVGLALLCVILLFTRGCGDKSEQQPQGTTPVPQTLSKTTQATLVEDLEYVASHFPSLQLNSVSVPYTCVVGVEIMEDESKEDLQSAVKEEMARDGVNLKEVEIHNLTIVLNEQNDRFTGFIVRVTGKKEDDSSFDMTDVYVGDGTWTTDKSDAFAKDLRRQVEQNPLYSLRAEGGGHRVRLEINIPHSRPVDDD